MKRIILIELTILWEDRCEEVSEKKATKYLDLVQQCREKDCMPGYFPMRFAAVCLEDAHFAQLLHSQDRRERKQKQHLFCLWNKREELSYMPGDDVQ